uniref:protein-tyrosine-phosphatase n=1 Tax=Podarcis muralis TaxID=64176 RepID=A0A670KHT1_PODMU
CDSLLLDPWTLGVLTPGSLTLGLFVSQLLFIKNPVDQIGVSGGVASFVCQARGDPKPRVTWNKKGKKVNSQRFETIEFDEGAGAVLRIQPLRTPRDENIYECVAQNSVAEITVNAKLTVLREDQLPSGFPIIDMGPQLKVVERTRTATMLCAASGNPDPEITWFKDFLPVDPSASNGRIKQLRSGGLQIESSEETDQGKYECVASNSAGVRYSSPANLYVRVRRVAPRFSIPPSSHEIMPGGNVNITCVAVGSPMPYVKWMQGAEDLTPEDDMPVGRNVLELTDVKDSANYTCVAMSSLGVIEAVAQITVKSLPKAPGTPIVTETTATSITITWDSGNPDPVSYYVIEYKSKSQDGPYQIKEDITTTRYSIGGLSPNSEYEIWVSAVNTIGQGPPSDPVVMRTGEQAPASAPRNVQGRMLSASTMIIQWEEPVEPNGQIRGYRVYYTMEPDQPVSNWQKHNVDDSLLTTVSSLLEMETYTVRVLAFTSVGDGPLSDPIQVKTKQGVPGQPMNFRAEAKSDSSILLTWSPPRQDIILKYELVFKDATQTRTFDPVTSFTVRDLKPNTEYVFKLAARSALGIGAETPEVRERTLQAKPSAPPRDVKCVSTRSTAILVSWRPPPAESQNGVLNGYSVRYRALDSEDTEPREVTNIHASTNHILLESLEKWTEYRITVVAHTMVGSGPESSPVIVRTDEDVPSAPPRKVEVEVLNSTAIQVSWRSPLQNRQHGQIRGYQVHYIRMENGEASGLPQIKDVMLADAQEMIIAGLQPETAYSITVAAYTMKGDGARSKPKVAVTKGAVPGKPILSVHPTQENALLVKWEPPLDAEGQVLGYRLQFGRRDVDPLATLEFSSEEDRYTATNIHRGATYVFKLAVKSRSGFGEEAVQELTIPEDVPKGYPQILEASNITSKSVQFHWMPPVMAERNGVIVKYTVAYREAASSGSPQEKDLPPSPENSYTLNGLKPNTAYDVKIRAHTSKGPGPYSPSVQYRTFLLDQVFPKNFKVRMLTKTSVLLGWEFPENYNSAVPYTIQYEGKEIEVDGRATKKLITNLRPHTLYRFILKGPKGTLGNLQQQVEVSTAANLLSRKPEVTYRHDLDGSIVVNLPEVKGSDSPAFCLAFFSISVVPHVADLNLLPRGPLPQLIQISRLQRRSLRHSRQLDLHKPYIAARFNTLPSYFILGDLKRYEGFENKALEPGQKYVIFVLAVLRASDPKRFSPLYAASPFSDPIQIDNPDPQPKIDGEEGLIWVIGPVLAVVFIICIVIAILLYKNKRKDSEPRIKCMLNNAEITPHHPKDPVEMRRINFQTPGMLSHPPIPISELADHTEHLKANDNLKLSQEYESIDPGQQFTWEHSNLEVNKPKNRYANVIAYDHSRVILLPIEGIVGSDYINANYIDGYRKQNAYIATQGPLPETFGDFWRMVWEQRSATVVMMTKLEEKSRVRKTHTPFRPTLSNHYADHTDARTDLRWCYHFPKSHCCCLVSTPGTPVFHCLPQFGQTHVGSFENTVQPSRPLPSPSPYALHLSQHQGLFQGVFSSPEVAGPAWLQRKRQPAGGLKEPKSNLLKSTAIAQLSKISLSCLQDSNSISFLCISPQPNRDVLCFSLPLPVLHPQDGQSRTVRQFQFTDWPEQGVPKSGEGFIDFIGQVHKTKEQFGQDGPISVHCSAGVGRTGVFITLSIVLERMRYEGVVDIFQTVKMLRTQRPAMVQTEDEYQFCYQAALEYLGSFDHYAT